MANGETITEIKALLAEPDSIPTKTALRLSLDLQLQIFEKQAAQDLKNIELDKRLKVVEDSSIVLWAQKNPKLFIFLVTVYLIVANLVNVKDVLALAVGLK